MKNKCTPWLAAFEMFRHFGSSLDGAGGCRHSTARARQPGFCFFSGTSSLRAPHDVSEPWARSSQAERAPLAVPSRAWPRRHSWELKAANRLFLCAVGGSEPFVILHQPFRIKHHLLEVKPLPWGWVWRQHGSQGGNGTILEPGEPSDGYVWVEHARSLAVFCSVFRLNWLTVALRGPDSDHAYTVSSMGACSLTLVTKLLGDQNQSQAVF